MSEETPQAQERPKRELTPKSEQKWETNEKLTFALTTLAFAADAIVASVLYSRDELNVILFAVILLGAVIGLAGMVGAWHFKKVGFFAMLGALVVLTGANIYLVDWVNIALHAFLSVVIYGLLAISSEILE
ncbi:MAG: hypothetical protein AAFQ07_01115 [Chloroflexota bacterium]